MYNAHNINTCTHGDTIYTTYTAQRKTAQRTRHSYNKQQMPNYQRIFMFQPSEYD
jgi:hypothetical protein